MVEKFLDGGGGGGGGKIKVIRHEIFVSHRRKISLGNHSVFQKISGIENHYG